jgi:hypothetical protein
VLVDPALERKPVPPEDLTAYVARKDAEQAKAAERAAGDAALNPESADATQQQGASVESVKSVGGGGAGAKSAESAQRGSGTS